YLRGITPAHFTLLTSFRHHRNSSQSTPLSIPLILLRAQRLSASSEFSQSQSWEGNFPVFCAQRLSASSEFSPPNFFPELSLFICVLNAFRHNRNSHWF